MVFLIFPSLILHTRQFLKLELLSPYPLSLSCSLTEGRSSQTTGEERIHLRSRSVRNSHGLFEQQATGAAYLGRYTVCPPRTCHHTNNTLPASQPAAATPPRYLWAPKWECRVQIRTSLPFSPDSTGGGWVSIYHSVRLPGQDGRRSQF